MVRCAWVIKLKLGSTFWVLDTKGYYHCQVLNQKHELFLGIMVVETYLLQSLITIDANLHEPFVELTA